MYIYQQFCVKRKCYSYFQRSSILGYYTSVNSGYHLSKLNVCNYMLSINIV